MWTRKIFLSKLSGLCLKVSGHRSVSWWSTKPCLQAQCTAVPWMQRVTWKDVHTNCAPLCFPKATNRLLWEQGSPRCYWVPFDFPRPHHGRLTAPHQKGLIVVWWINPPVFSDGLNTPLWTAAPVCFTLPFPTSTSCYHLHINYLGSPGLEVYF